MAAPRASGSVPSPVQIRRLGPTDVEVLSILAREDADFDLDGRGGATPPLDPDAAATYLGEPRVLHWVAEMDGLIAGFLSAHHLPLRSGEGAEVLLYEIGVRKGYRRRGIGRALIGTLRSWMHDAALSYVWVLADNHEARMFYEACGFRLTEGTAIYLEAGGPDDG